MKEGKKEGGKERRSSDSLKVCLLQVKVPYGPLRCCPIVYPHGGRKNKAVRTQNPEEPKLTALIWWPLGSLKYH